MRKGKRNPALDYRKKDRNKRIKTIAQAVILLAVGMLLFQTVFDIRQYEEPDKTEWTNHQGFIALSYFGVGRTGTPKLVAKKQLDQQLKALQDQGYVTISQQDVLDFYQKGKPLPDKALFLSFEDGRNDSSLFAQPLLEKYNYKATFLSYANKMGNSDHKFVQPNDMLKMAKTGYWELGTNGNRLTYINIIDKGGRYIGVREENEVPAKGHIEYYNHYLMDFIRDENMIPLEHRAEMEKRINADYKTLEDIYRERLGFVPNVYMIMHANALHNGMNPLVANVNEDNIERLFKMHFNRDGQAFNSREESVFDLTRVQPAPYWYTNHLLMKIQQDTGTKMKFVRGDEQRAGAWSRISGAAQFMDNRIALTSPPGEAGMLVLKDSGSLRDVQVTATLAGNVVGRQTVYIRYDREKDSFLRIALENNELMVEQKRPGHDVESVYAAPLDEIQWKPEDLAFDKASVYTKEQTLAGTRKEKEPYPINIKHTRAIDIRLQGDQLDIIVDNQSVVAKRKVDQAVGSGGVALESRCNELNKKDDIYDGVFDDVQVASLDKDSGPGTVVTVYSNALTGWDRSVHKVGSAIDDAIDWAIETF